MGKKEYEKAAEIVRQWRKDHPTPMQGERVAEAIEDAFVTLFNSFDSKGRFDNRRFREACRKVDKS